ncbi:hypothetical protein Q4555_13105 [Octadecabacter sp. 1_MG-2023]|uniref:ankyrin repeat domain-containing protein n=1 Tax=unclassified Octadecabacter TaxID=196158 RepID=UPI001C08BA5D|nr:MULTISPECIES: hypothetical protein [unclassified Octadecabacter]MBU2993546.1 hypothetical protein [Octadecabacter sp. B2R22]MDO6735610.1 hypothetical protein [Octadecabacter sp. 1_MG-2023]
MRFLLGLGFSFMASVATACPLMTHTGYVSPSVMVNSVKICSDEGVDFNAGPSGGDAIFRRVIVSGWSAEAVQLGLEAGGNPNIQSRHGSPAFVDLVNFADQDSEPVVVEILEVLGAAGANFSTPDNNGDLALSKAAGGGELDTVRVLLRWRADPNGLNTYNRSPLFETVFGRCSPDVGRMLIQNGARIDVMPQDQIERMFVEAAETCTNRQGRAYVRELETLDGR